MLQIKSLNKSFSEKQIFKNFNLELKDTDNLIISGTSGSGKSTLAQIIAGLDDNEGMVSYKRYDAWTRVTARLAETYSIRASI